MDGAAGEESPDKTGGVRKVPRILLSSHQQPQRRPRAAINQSRSANGPYELYEPKFPRSRLHLLMHIYRARRLREKG
jgi:hypothetical protein